MIKYNTFYRQSQSPLLPLVRRGSTSTYACLGLTQDRCRTIGLSQFLNRETLYLWNKTVINTIQNQI